MQHTKNNQNPEVNIIPATRRHISSKDHIHGTSVLRIAAYCRVSTEDKSQENSYAVQKSHYTMLISGNPHWQMAGIYADEGKSGTSRKRRIQFNQMIEDAKAGKMDYIITKSISRFARNTAEALDCVHELQRLRPPVGVYFERENIDTLNNSSEIFLTFYCSMAQEESRSISENIKWSIRNNFRSGKPQINLRRMLGYDQCKDGNWVINESQAQTVRYIYERFLQGASANAIAKELNAAKMCTVNGGIWRADTVFTVLRNEKYAGDLHMQKTYTESFLTHKAVPNNGEYPQYFLKDHHPAIIERPVWNQVQELLVLRQHRSRKLSRKVSTSIGEIEICTGDAPDTAKHCGPPLSPFHGLSCAACGAVMRRMIYTAPGGKNRKKTSQGTRPRQHAATANSCRAGDSDSHTGTGPAILCAETHPTVACTKANPAASPASYAVWKCPNSPGKSKKTQLERTCQTPTIPEKSLEQSFTDLLYSIKNDLQTNTEQALILRDFHTIYNAIRRTEIHSEYMDQKLKLIDMQLAELEHQYEQLLQQQEIFDYSSRITLGGEAFLTDPRDYIRNTALNDTPNRYADLAAEIKKELDEKKQEKEDLINHHNLSDIMKKNFEAFLTSLQNAPADPPPNSTFCAYIIRNFVLKIEAVENQICYSTTFGMQLTTVVGHAILRH